MYFVDSGLESHVTASDKRIKGSHAEDRDLLLASEGEKVLTNFL